MGTALLVAGLLAACSGHPGAAAVVDGEAIRTDELRSALDDLAPVYPGVTAQGVLTILVTEPFLAEVAAARGLGVSDEQARAFLVQQAAQQLGEEEAAALDFGEEALVVGRYSVAADAVQGSPDGQAAAEEYRELLTEADIDVNPRFGTFQDAGVAPPATPEWVVPAGGRAPATPGDGGAGDGGPAPTPTSR
ncbi:hypothetical protein [Cellulomonas shaoxiangyii]|uniref:SurA N-terminal domain-containing protein n=1 Tax=Cellulomonas shaoxiangyii TaxID=2566013 RepID=A0A4V1CMX1_9CELL|nr:hypothetical protein [Cellulomonas shaoxiangyii]QCB94425.1 hypothetical protein E5225_13545 [Cellulomonas shaoxiangyii]TGY79624.1 hypothetical protein E5226_15360 [Cellulomonas shaoxiangyii]